MSLSHLYLQIFLHDNMNNKNKEKIKVKMLPDWGNENLGFLVFFQPADPFSLSTASELLIKL